LPNDVLRRPFVHLIAVALAAGIAGCGSSGSAPNPPSNPNPNLAPVPTPVPTPTPNAFAAACGTPLPRFEDAYGMGIKVQLEPTRDKKVLTANPQVRNFDYCAAAGIPNSTICNTRREDNPERTPCDHYLAGISDTGRPGPNWFQEVDGKLLRCGGVGGVPEEAPNCFLKETNQYLVDVYAGGLYVACGGAGSPRSCSGCVLDEDSFGVIHHSPAGLCKPS